MMEVCGYDETLDSYIMETFKCENNTMYYVCIYLYLEMLIKVNYLCTCENKWWIKEKCNKLFLTHEFLGFGIYKWLS